LENPANTNNPFENFLIDYPDNSMNSRRVTTKSYFNDTVIWKDQGKSEKIEIPVCWENLESISPDNQVLPKKMLKKTWEAVSLVEFSGWKQCPEVFDGVRITSEDARHPQMPNVLASPYVHGLGASIKGKKRGVVLNFALQENQSLVDACNDAGADLMQCVEASIVHEFGHVLGLSHEHNRPTEPILDRPIFRPFCGNDDPLTVPDIVPNFSNNPLHGNTFFTDFDKQSIMNYCGKKHYAQQTLSPIDVVAVKVYYGRMPTYDGSTDHIIIPRVIAGEKSYKVVLIPATAEMGVEGAFVYGSVVETKQKSEVETTFLNNSISLPMVRFTKNGKIAEIWKGELKEKPDGSFALDCGKTQRTHPTEGDLLC